MGAASAVKGAGKAGAADVVGVVQGTAGQILPVLSRESVSDFANQILREDERIRNAVIRNPDYRILLEDKVRESFARYKGVMTGGKLVDSWDRVVSGVRIISDAAAPASGGAGFLISALFNVADLIPKGLYGVYYTAKTGDWKAAPMWTAYEAASFIPYVGEAIDFMNVYIDRARWFTKEKAKKEFMKTLRAGREGSGLEKKVA